MKNSKKEEHSQGVWAANSRRSSLRGCWGKLSCLRDDQDSTSAHSSVNNILPATTIAHNKNPDTWSTTSISHSRSKHLHPNSANRRSWRKYLCHGHCKNG